METIVMVFGTLSISILTSLSIAGLAVYAARKA